MGGRRFLPILLAAWWPVFATAQLPWTTLHPPSLAHAISVAYFDAGAGAPTHVTYLTDGGKWVSETDVRDDLRALHAAHAEYPPTRYVLVGTVDSATNVDHRRTLFACGNEAWRAALAEAVLPWAEAGLPTPIVPTQRTLVGLSLGGAHAAHELTRADAVFGTFVLFSPITYDCPDLARQLAFTSAAYAKTRRAYVSTGRLDAESYALPLARLLEGAGMSTALVHTDGDHDFANWWAQWPRVLAWLHGAEAGADARP